MNVNHTLRIHVHSKSSIKLSSGESQRYSLWNKYASIPIILAWITFCLESCNLIYGRTNMYHWPYHTWKLQAWSLAVHLGHILVWDLERFVNSLEGSVSEYKVPWCHSEIKLLILWNYDMYIYVLLVRYYFCHDVYSMSLHSWNFSRETYPRTSITALT